MIFKNNLCIYNLTLYDYLKKTFYIYSIFKNFVIILFELSITFEIFGHGSMLLGDVMQERK